MKETSKKVPYQYGSYASERGAQIVCDYINKVMNIPNKCQVVAC